MPGRPAGHHLVAHQAVTVTVQLNLLNFRYSASPKGNKDAIGPLADTLNRELGFNDTQIGTLNAIYSLSNIFLVLAGGFLCDRFGAGKVAFWTAIICLAGAAISASFGEFIPVCGEFLFFA